MWASVINPSILSFLFLQVHSINQSKEFPGGKKSDLPSSWRPNVLSEIGHIILYIRIHLFSTLLWCFSVEAFKPQGHLLVYSPIPLDSSQCQNWGPTPFLFPAAWDY